MNRRRIFGLVVVGLLVGGVSAAAAQQGAGAPAQATQRAQRQQEREARRKALEQMTPEEREKLREERRAMKQKEKEDKPPKLMEIRGPLPLPVEVKNPASPVVGGKPAGASCAGTDTCTLKLKPNAAEVVVVTAVWSATKVQCDDLSMATPASGAPITVLWRCQHQLLVEGPGAGYAGFVVGK